MPVCCVRSPSLPSIIAVPSYIPFFAACWYVCGVLSYATCRGKVQGEGPDTPGEWRNLVHGQRTSGGHQVRPCASLDATTACYSCYFYVTLLLYRQKSFARRPAAVPHRGWPLRARANDGLLGCIPTDGCRPRYLTRLLAGLRRVVLLWCRV